MPKGLSAVGIQVVCSLRAAQGKAKRQTQGGSFCCGLPSCPTSHLCTSLQDPGLEDDNGGAKLTEARIVKGQAREKDTRSWTLQDKSRRRAQPSRKFERLNEK